MNTNQTIDDRCAMLARNAAESSCWIVLARSRREAAIGMPQPLAADTLNYWLHYIIREKRVVVSNANRIIALRTAEQANVAQVAK